MSESEAVTVRLLAADDYEALIALWQRSGLSHRPGGRDSREAILQQLKDGRVAIVGVELEGKLIGAVVVSDDGRKGWINRLAVDPAHRSHGLGGRLIRAAEEELRGRGLSIFAALSEARNEASLRLFEREGYATLDGVVYLSKRKSPDV